MYVHDATTLTDTASVTTQISNSVKLVYSNSRSDFTQITDSHTVLQVLNEATTLSDRNTLTGG
jgi:hypothetical protein